MYATTYAIKLCKENHNINVSEPKLVKFSILFNEKLIATQISKIITNEIMIP
jgi:hypothetical protein